MVKFKVRDLMHVVGFLDLVFSKEGLKDVPTYLPGLRTSCTQLKMAVSVRHIDDLLDAKNTSKDEAAYYHFLERECGNLADTVRRELDTKIVLAVPDEASIELFENEYPFDTEKIKVNDRFPLAVQDIQEAANCLALSRPTACVCHLMRVLEIGLQTLAQALNVPFANQRDWQDAINAIEGQIKLYQKGSISPLPADWKEKKQFYSELATQFTHFKEAWRNYAMHARVFYAETKAETIFGSVREFMRVLASRLSAAPS